MRKHIALITAVLLILSCISFVGCRSEKGITVLDSMGNLMGAPKKSEYSLEDIENEGYSAYIDAVLTEAAYVLSEKLDCTLSEAGKRLFRDGYTVKTAFVPEVYSALWQMNRDYESEKVNVGCAVTDYDGNLLAVFSTEGGNFALAAESPHSAFKPLSVYAPAMESGVINWSSMYVDMPYSTVYDSAGNLKEWPSNANGSYSGERVCIYDGVKYSLNTMAVHTLHDYGVTKSIDFLSDAFNIDFSYEKSRMAIKGEDEVIGNIALGSLYSGVSTVDMAGYYQIFGNLGKYEKPHSILEICDGEGESVYKYKSEKKQIISEETAYIMNRLLMGVCETDGTGEDAYCDGIEVAGKTGTGNYGEGNWFVGVTPEYSIAVWHSASQIGNFADVMFSGIMHYMPECKTEKFKPSERVSKTVICRETGDLFSAGCMRMQVGYYVDGSELKECSGH